MVVLAVAALTAFSFSSPLAAQTSAAPDDPVTVLLGRLEQALRDGSPERYLELLGASADRTAAGAFAQAFIGQGTTRAIVRERDRLPLKGTLPDQGYSLLVEVFVESRNRARIATWRLDVRPRLSSVTAGWGIVGQEVLTTLQGLHRLGLNVKRQVTVKDLVVSAEDFTLTVPEGSLFLGETESGATAVVVLGRGEMVFAPAPAAERSQLRVVTGGETLQASFEAAFLRVSPADFDSRIVAREMVDRPAVDARDLKRAEEVFRQDVGKSFCLELADLSPELWSLLPAAGDFLAEVRTRRYDTLTYARSGSEIEDISLFDRKSRRNLSVYASREHLDRYSRFYSEDEKSDYVVQSYDLEVRYQPVKNQLDGLARLAIETTATTTNSLTLKLADPLSVRSVVARELGRLLCVKVRNQESVVVNLPTTLMKGFRLNLEILYGGRLEPQPIDRELAGSGLTQDPSLEDFEIPLEESHLFSNRSYWYPQAPVLGYAPAQIRVTLDEPWAAVASGRLLSVTLAPGLVDRGVKRREFSFSAAQPVRYLALLVARLTEVRREKLVLHNKEVELVVSATPRQRGRGREVAKTAASILKFYTSLAGDFPYSSLMVAAVERRLPGGHSPPYMAVLAMQGMMSSLRWSDDPGALPFPDFFVAHELAHQWWGQSVGWKNYHEQWISEGFAQYFAALYAERSLGRPTFDAIIRRMQGWAVDKSDQGPIYLGYRIGHAKGDARLFRAVVYNKGAMVLHMLRGLLGDEAFFRGLQGFYSTWRFKKAGTDDFRKAMEAVSGADLGRFFDQWVLAEGLPQVSFSWRTDSRDGANEAVVRLEQTSGVYDLPVTVTLEYEDNTTTSVTVKLTDQVLETRLPLSRKLRRVDVNRDRAALGVFRAVGSQP